MLIMRFALVLIGLTLALSGAMYVLTRNRRYLNFAWQTVRLTVILIVIFGLMFVLERYVLVAWRVFL
jgi:hypothetical protein